MASAISMTDQDREISEIIAESRGRLRNFIRRRVANEADAEDLLQEVFFEVIAAYRLTEPVQQWGAWMFRVARNRVIDFFRKRKYREMSGEAQTGADDTGQRMLEEVLPSANAGPAETYASSVLLEAIEDALEELPEEQREVFIAHEISGYSFKEIAAQTGASVNTLLSRKHYAVVYLRRRLAGVYKEFVKSGETR